MVSKATPCSPRKPIVESAREQLDILSAYAELGSSGRGGAVRDDPRDRQAGHRAPHPTTCRATEEHGRPDDPHPCRGPLPGLADNGVVRLIEGALRADLVIVDDLGFARWTTSAPNSCSGSSPPPMSAVARPRVALAVESWGRFLPEHTIAVVLLDRLLHHSVTVVTSDDSYRMKEARLRGGGPPTTL